MPPLIKVQDQPVLVETKNFPHAKWDFDKFNPVQSRVFDYYDKYVNGLIATSTGSGKAQPDDAIVLTVHGYKKISDLSVGDFVIGGDGKPTEVIGVFPQGYKDVFRVTFSDKVSTECCEDHLWAVKTRHARCYGSSWKVLSLKEIYSTLKPGEYHIPFVGEIEFPERSLGLHPYVMGVLLGDGGVGYGSKVTISDPGIKERFESLLPHGNKLVFQRNYDYLIVGDGEWNPVLYELSQLGILGLRSYEKFIPWIYKYASVDQRKELVKGLMDSDGGCKSGGSPTFDVTSKLLSEGMAFLIRSLGGWTRERIKSRSTYRWKGEKRYGRPVYRLTVGLDFNPFSEKAKKGETYYAKSCHPIRKIMSIEPAGNKLCRCIKVRNDDGLYVTNDCIVTHNTVVAEMFIAEEIRKRGGKGMFLAPLRALAREKVTQWTNKKYHFGDLKVSICTGDYRLTPERSKELAAADIIIMTSEMLSHLSRSHKSEKNNWLSQIGVLCVDECLPPSAMVETDKGMISIGRIIEEKLDVKVASFNHSAGHVEYKKIIARQKKLLKRKWIALYYNGGDICVTSNHLIWCEGRGYIPSKTVQKGDIIYVRVSDAKGKTNNSGNFIGGRLPIQTSTWQVCPTEGTTISQTEGFSRVEIQRVEEVGWNPTKNSPKQGLREGTVQIQHSFEQINSGSLQSLLSKQQKSCELKLAERDNRPCSLSCVVHGRWQSEQGSNGNSYGRIFQKGSFSLVGLALQEMVDIVPSLSDKKLLANSIFVGGSRQISQSDKGGDDSGHELQNYSKAGRNILHNVRQSIHCESAGFTYNQKSIALWCGGMQLEVEKDDWQDIFLGEEESWCCDLEVEDNNNFFVNGVLVHNSHLLTVPGRGDHLEVGMMKFTQINPTCRLVLLSATMPNVEQIGEWVSYSLTKRETFSLQSQFRPVPLTLHYESYADEVKRYDWIEQEKVNKAMEIVEWYKNDKFLVFAHTKRTGNMMLSALRAARIDAEFHNADLESNDRIEVEDRFRNDKKLRVVVATSTLAAGLNMPARRVIILGTHRGLTEVENYDIMQMCGRAGRPGLDPMGDAYILIPESKESEWIKKLSNPTRIESQLLAKSGESYKTLAFHLVSEIHQGDIETTEDVHKWYKRSLAYFQNKELEDTVVDKTLKDLAKYGAIFEEDEKWATRPIGKVASMFYFSPFDVSGLYFNFRNLFADGKENDDYAISIALANIDSQWSGIVSRAEKDEMSAFTNRVRQSLAGSNLSDGIIKAAYCYFNLLNGITSQNCASVQRNLQFDFNRLSQVLQALDSFAGQWNKFGWFKGLEGRIAYGVPAYLVDLCQIPNVKQARAKKLYDAGIKTVDDLAAADPERVRKLLNMKADKIEEIISDAVRISLV